MESLPSLAKRKAKPPANSVSPAQPDRPGSVLTRLWARGQRVVAPVVIVSLAILGFSWLSATSPEPAAHTPLERSWPVAAKKVTVGIVQPELHLYGRIRGSNLIEIRSGTEGFVVERGANFARGALVQEGELLVALDEKDLTLDLRRALAILAEAEARQSQLEAGFQGAQQLLERDQALLELAESRLRRQSQLRRQNVVSNEALERVMSETEVAKRSVTQTEVNLATAEALLAQQQAIVTQTQIALERAQLELTRARVTAPEAAIVETASVNTGTRLLVNMAIGTLIPLAGLEAEFRLSADQYARLITAPTPLHQQPVVLDWKGQLTLTGHLTRLDPRVDDSGGGIMAYAKVDNLGIDTPLRPGAFLTVRLPDRSFEQVVRLPESAIMPDGRIYGISLEQRLEGREFELVLRSEGEVLVRGDFHDGDCIVLTRFSHIGAGIKVDAANCDLPDGPALTTEVDTTTEEAS